MYGKARVTVWPGPQVTVALLLATVVVLPKASVKVTMYVIATFLLTTPIFVTAAAAVTVDRPVTVVGSMVTPSCMSGITLMKKPNVCVLGESSPSLTEQETSVMTPVGKTDPEAWSHVTMGLPSSSLAVGMG